MPKPTIWTPEKVELLKRFVEQGMDYKAIALKMQTTPMAVNSALTRYRIPRESKWTESNITKLRELASLGKTKYELADYFGVTVEAIRCQCFNHKISLKNPTCRFWTPEEEFFLDESAGILRTADIAKKLKRSTDSVRIKARKMGLSLHTNLDNISALELVKVTGISPRTIYEWIKDEKLKATRSKGRKAYKIKLKDFADFVNKNPNRRAIKRVKKEVLEWLLMEV